MGSNQARRCAFLSPFSYSVSVLTQVPQGSITPLIFNENMQSLEQTNVGFLKLKPDFQPLRKLRVESSLESREDK